MSVNEAIRSALTAHMSPMRVVDLSLTEIRDSDGDEALRIEVVYDPMIPPSPAKMFSLTTVLREVLAQNSDQRFPLVSFVSQDEWGEAAA